MADEDEDDVKPAGGGSNKILLILVLVNVLGLAGLAAYLVLFQNTAAPAQAQEGEEGEEGEGESEEEREPDAYEIGPLVELEPLVVNVAGSSTGRFLRVTLHIELRKEESRPDVEAAMVPIRNKLLIFFSQLDPSRIQDGEGKDAIRDEIVDAVNEVLGARVIRRVFYTEFVAQ